MLRSPHAHARIVDIDVTGALEVDGLIAIWTYDDLTGPLADPLPLLIPHPTLTHGRTPYALARDEVNHVGEADRDGGRPRPLRRRGRRPSGSASTYEPLPAVVGIEAARAARHLVHDDVPGNVGARTDAGERRRGRGASPARRTGSSST